jgi:hypothetical protein
MQRFVYLGLAVLVLAAACAPAGYPRQPGEYYPHISDVPPSFYDNDPTLRHWYTYPYWNPDRIW